MPDSQTCADPERGEAGGPDHPPLGNHMWLYLFLDILARCPLDKQLIVSIGRVVRPTVKYVDD